MEPKRIWNRWIKRTCGGCGGTQYLTSLWGIGQAWLCKVCGKEDEA